MATEYFNDAWRIPNNKNQSLVSNYSMKFNGTNDVINCGNDSSLQITGAMTVSYWFKGQGGSGNVVGGVGKLGNNGSRGFCLGMTSTGAITFFIAPTASSVVSASYSHTPDTNWHHLVGVFTPSTSLEIYFDGQLVDTTPTSTSSQYNASNNLQIGARGDSTGFFDGEIDQVSVFDYALPATGTNSVATLYGGGTAVTNPMGLSPAPVAYYQLGDQTASNNTTEPTPPVESYLVPNNSLQDYVFASFGSLSGSIDLANPVPLGTNKTVSFWFKLSSSSYSFSPFTSIVNSGNCYYPFVTSVSGRWYVSDSACTGGTFLQIGSGVTLQVNQWLHAAAVGDGSSIKCYINGVEIFSNASDRNPTIQRLIYGTTNSQTEFSNFSIFNTNLPATGTESIASLYNNGNPPDLTNYSNIIHWWKLNAQDTFDGTNWTVTDYIGGNTGTSNGMTSANLITSNLQHTSGYSPYALDFDGINDYLDCGNVSDFNFGTGDFTVSSWINISSGNSFYRWIFGYGQTTGLEIGLNNTTNNTLRLWIAGSQLNSSESISSNTWHNLILKRESGSISAFLDNTSLTLSGSGGAGSISNNNTYIGVWGDGSKDFFQGSISNISAWNTGLTSSQISEIYNEGVPSNLHNFSGTAPVAWWQLGTNSSFNPNPIGTQGTWTCLDEIGSNNAASSNNMTNDDIVNGVGYSGNGLGTSSIEIVGDAPYSTANGISENMDVLDRTTDVPPTV